METRRPLVIVGAGAVGTAIAARLDRAGADAPLLVTRSRAKAERLRAGVKLEGDLSGRTSLNCVSWEESPRIAEGSVCLVTVKAFELAQALRDLSNFADPGAVELLLACNGLGIWEEAMNGAVPLDAARCGRAVIWLGAAWSASGGLRLSGSRGLEWAGAAPGLEAWKGDFAAAGIPISRFEGGPHALEWRKGLANVVINALCSLARAPNRAILENPALRELAERVLEEAVAVARARGVKLEPPDEARVWEIARVTGDNFNSTWLDLQAGRPTEVPWLNGRVAALAAEFGLSAPANRVVAGLIAALEENIENR